MSYLWHIETTRNSVLKNVSRKTKGKKKAGNPADQEAKNEFLADRAKRMPVKWQTKKKPGVGTRLKLT